MLETLVSLGTRAAVAWRALRAGDAPAALGLTLELVSSGYAPAWELCVALCENESVSELTSGGVA